MPAPHPFCKSQKIKSQYTISYHIYPSSAAHNQFFELHVGKIYAWTDVVNKIWSLRQMKGGRKCLRKFTTQSSWTMHISSGVGNSTISRAEKSDTALSSSCTIGFSWNSCIFHTHKEKQIKRTLDRVTKEAEQQHSQADQQHNTDNQETPAPPVSCTKQNPIHKKLKIEVLCFSYIHHNQHHFL